MIPERISHYRILAKLGEGGMGIVYSAEDETLRRPVAIKLISSTYVKDPMALKRFAREVKIASGLHHANICTVYDCGQIAGHPYMVMELLEGQTLRDMLDGRPLPVARILEFGIAVAGALHEAHEHGIIHRDVNATNIFVSSDGIVKVLDFGLAKICGANPLGAATLLRPTSDVSSPGLAIGTASNMSPEQVTGQELDRRSDLFALGVVLYEMATGVRPFVGATDPLVMHAILYKHHATASKINSKIPPGLDLIIKRALEKDRAKRYNTAREIQDDLLCLQADAAPPLDRQEGGAQS